ncbi:MAG: hypothetical protein IK005_10195 [Paludibacteraceae bacterium]|nr:hypothetical protein [Paludibacteraceae bacterium]MBR4840830.1 hypothetical protein [Paludibacteraceae bacterium]
MKKFFYILSLFAVCACTNKPANNGSSENATSEFSQTATDNCSEYMENLANGFAKAVMSGDLQKAMTYLDPNYVREQHDGFLEGRTNQFFLELLAGTIIGEDGSENFYVPSSLNEITSIDVSSTNCTETPSATFLIKLKDGRSFYLTIDTEEANTAEGVRPMFVGAVG